MRYLPFLFLVGCSAGVHPILGDGGDAGIDPTGDGGFTWPDATDVDLGTKLPPDAGNEVDASDPPDTGVPPPVDAGSPVGVTLTFPQAPPDTAVQNSGTSFYYLPGDGVSGHRSAALATATSADVTFHFTNDLIPGSCAPGPSLSFVVSLNATPIGSLDLLPGADVVMQHFDFAAVPSTGGGYDISYTISARACGSIQIPAFDARNTITLH